MRPPALPLAPAEYSQEYINTLTRVLTQYFNKIAADDAKVQQKSDIEEILFWLS